MTDKMFGERHCPLKIGQKDQGPLLSQSVFQGGKARLVSGRVVEGIDRIAPNLEVDLLLYVFPANESPFLPPKGNIFLTSSDLTTFRDQNGSVERCGTVHGRNPSPVDMENIP